MEYFVGMLIVAIIALPVMLYLTNNVVAGRLYSAPDLKIMGLPFYIPSNNTEILGWGFLTLMFTLLYSAIWPITVPFTLLVGVVYLLMKGFVKFLESKRERPASWTSH